MGNKLLIAVPSHLKKIMIGHQFVVVQQFGFNDLESYYSFLEWIDTEGFQRVSERITASFQVSIIVDDFVDAAKIQTFLQTQR